MESSQGINWLVASRGILWNPRFTMVNDRVQFYQEHLNRVSRSFAFCIERLGSPLRAQVSLAYLICRILDTVEDADWTEREAQVRHFELFERYFVQPFSDSEIATWVEGLPKGLSEGEQLLLQESGSIFRDFQALPLEIREAIQDPVLSMCRGMRYFATRSGSLRLVSLKEVNQYCFFVAGVVGEILTRLADLARGESQVDRNVLVNSFHFGLFLQKVNLLKDQYQDEQSGRFLVPSRGELAGSLREHAVRAIEYITAMPEKLLGYRLFCSWSLFLGLASLPFIEKSWRERSTIKIPRAQTQALLGQIEIIVSDNRRLREMFETFFAISGAGTAPMSVATETAPDGFPSLYRGRLSIDDQRTFGLL